MKIMDRKKVLDSVIDLIQFHIEFILLQHQISSTVITELNGSEKGGEGKRKREREKRCYRFIK